MLAIREQTLLLFPNQTQLPTLEKSVVENVQLFEISLMTKGTNTGKNFV